MKIIFYSKNKAMPADIKSNVTIFLNNYIPKGTVIMDSTVYDEADIKAIVIGRHGEILGFSAQKIFSQKYYNIIQVLGTFLDRKTQGKKLACLLLQGRAFLISWIRKPFKQIYWCTRTRIPGVYRIAARYHEIYPSIRFVSNNRNMGYFAECIAKTVYGENIEFNKDTGVMKNSYRTDSLFVNLPRKKGKGHINAYFEKHLNYQENETIFICAKMDLIVLLKYSLLSTIGSLITLFSRVFNLLH